MQHLGLPAFRPALCCSPCRVTSYDAEVVGVEGVDGSARLHLSPMAFMVNFYVSYGTDRSCVCCLVVISFHVFNHPTQRHQIGCLSPVVLGLYGPNINSFVFT